MSAKGKQPLLPDPSLVPSRVVKIPSTSVPQVVRGTFRQSRGHPFQNAYRYRHSYRERPVKLLTGHRGGVCHPRGKTYARGQYRRNSDSLTAIKQYQNGAYLPYPANYQQNQEPQPYFGRVPQQIPPVETTVSADSMYRSRGGIWRQHHQFFSRPGDVKPYRRRRSHLDDVYLPNYEDNDDLTEHDDSDFRPRERICYRSSSRGRGDFSSQRRPYFKVVPTNKNTSRSTSERQQLISKDLKNTQEKDKAKLSNEDRDPIEKSYQSSTNFKSESGSVSTVESVAPIKHVDNKSDDQNNNCDIVNVDKANTKSERCKSTETKLELCNTSENSNKENKTDQPNTPLANDNTNGDTTQCHNNEQNKTDGVSAIKKDINVNEAVPKTPELVKQVPPSTSKLSLSSPIITLNLSPKTRRTSKTTPPVRLSPASVPSWKTMLHEIKVTNVTEIDSDQETICLDEFITVDNIDTKRSYLYVDGPSDDYRIVDMDISTPSPVKRKTQDTCHDVVNKKTKVDDLYADINSDDILTQINEVLNEKSETTKKNHDEIKRYRCKSLTLENRIVDTNYLKKSKSEQNIRLKHKPNIFHFDLKENLLLSLANYKDAKFDPNDSVEKLMEIFKNAKKNYSISNIDCNNTKSTSSENEKSRLEPKKRKTFPSKINTLDDGNIVTKEIEPISKPQECNNVPITINHTNNESNNLSEEMDVASEIQNYSKGSNKKHSNGPNKSDNLNDDSNNLKNGKQAAIKSQKSSKDPRKSDKVDNKISESNNLRKEKGIASEPQKCAPNKSDNINRGNSNTRKEKEQRTSMTIRPSDPRLKNISNDRSSANYKNVRPSGNDGKPKDSNSPSNRKSHEKEMPEGGTRKRRAENPPSLKPEKQTKCTSNEKIDSKPRPITLGEYKKTIDISKRFPPPKIDLDIAIDENYRVKRTAYSSTSELLMKKIRLKYNSLFGELDSDEESSLVTPDISDNNSKKGENEKSDKDNQNTKLLQESGSDISSDKRKNSSPATNRYKSEQSTSGKNEKSNPQIYNVKNIEKGQRRISLPIKLDVGCQAVVSSENKLKRSLSQNFEKTPNESFKNKQSTIIDNTQLSQAGPLKYNNVKANTNKDNIKTKNISENSFKRPEPHIKSTDSNSNIAANSRGILKLNSSKNDKGLIKPRPKCENNAKRPESYRKVTDSNSNITANSKVMSKWKLPENDKGPINPHPLFENSANRPESYNRKSTDSSGKIATNTKDTLKSSGLSVEKAKDNKLPKANDTASTIKNNDKKQVPSNRTDNVSQISTLKVNDNRKGNKNYKTTTINKESTIQTANNKDEKGTSVVANDTTSLHAKIILNRVDDVPSSPVRSGSPKMNFALISESSYTKCGVLYQERFPMRQKCRISLVENECCDQAVILDNAEIQNDCTTVKQQTSNEMTAEDKDSDEVVEIKNDIPIIDLTDDAVDVKEEQIKDELKQERDAHEQNQEAIPENTITLYRSDETVNNGLEVQATSVSLSPIASKTNNKDVEIKIDEIEAINETGITPIPTTDTSQCAKLTESSTNPAATVQQITPTDIAPIAPSTCALIDKAIDEAIKHRQRQLEGNARKEPENPRASTSFQPGYTPNITVVPTAHPPVSGTWVPPLASTMVLPANNAPRPQANVDPNCPFVKPPPPNQIASSSKQSTGCHQYEVIRTPRRPDDEDDHHTLMRIPQSPRRTEDAPNATPQANRMTDSLEELRLYVAGQTPRRTDNAVSSVPQVMRSNEVMEVSSSSPRRVEQPPRRASLELVTQSPRRAENSVRQSPQRNEAAQIIPDLHVQELLTRLGAILIRYLLFFDSLRKAQLAYTEELKKMQRLLPIDITRELKRFDDENSTKFYELSGQVVAALQNLNLNSVAENPHRAQALVESTFKSLKEVLPRLTLTWVYLMLEALMRPERVHYLQVPFLRGLYNVVGMVTVRIRTSAAGAQVANRSNIQRDVVSPEQRRRLEWQINQYNTIGSRQRELMEAPNNSLACQLPTLPQNQLNNIRLSMLPQLQCHSGSMSGGIVSVANLPSSSSAGQSPRRIPPITNPVLLQHLLQPTGNQINPVGNNNQSNAIPDSTDDKPQKKTRKKRTRQTDDFRIRLPLSQPYDLMPSSSTITTSANSNQNLSVLHSPAAHRITQSSPVQRFVTPPGTPQGNIPNLTPIAEATSHVYSPILLARPPMISPPPAVNDLPSNSGTNSPGGSRIPEPSTPDLNTVVNLPTVKDESESPCSSQEIETIDLTWMDDIDPEQLQNEIDYIVVKKEEPVEEEEGNEAEAAVEEEVQKEEEVIEVMSSPADSGIESPPQQGDISEEVFTDRKCICNKRAEYVCECRTAMYCSEPCQAKDWKAHKEICQQSMKNKENQNKSDENTDKDDTNNE